MVVEVFFMTVGMFALGFWLTFITIMSVWTYQDQDIMSNLIEYLLKLDKHIKVLDKEVEELKKEAENEQR